ncbi:MAG: surface-adhesin E family protein [Thermodesulfobacteriota bacterium]
MRSFSVKLAVILLVMGLVTFYSKAWAADWKEFAEATTGVFHYDAASIHATPEGLVRVWIHNVSKQETNLVEFNCKAKSYRVLDVIQYDKANRIKSRETYYDNPTPHWYDISPKSVPEPLSMIVCP